MLLWRAGCSSRGLGFAQGPEGCSSRPELVVQHHIWCPRPLCRHKCTYTVAACSPCLLLKCSFLAGPDPTPLFALLLLPPPPPPPRLLRETFEPDRLTPTTVLDSASPNQVVVEVGPRLNFSTAWSTNATSICTSVGLNQVRGVGGSCVYWRGAKGFLGGGGRWQRMSSASLPWHCAVGHTGTPTASSSND
jgi:hypothetical protein